MEDISTSIEESVDATLSERDRAVDDTKAVAVPRLNAQMWRDPVLHRWEEVCLWSGRKEREGERERGEKQW